MQIQILIYDQVRAKAVLLRDLEELRAKRIALENPVQVVEEETGTSETEPSATNSTLADNSQPAPASIVKEEKPPSRSPEKPAPKDTDQPSQEPPKAPASKVLEAAKEQQVPTPPESSNEAVSSSNPIGLGINTEGIAAAPRPDTAGPADSATDSLFGIPDNDNDNGGADFTFGDIDFPPHDSTANTQNQELSQTQNNDFDLSTFGDTSQDFNMSDIQTSADANTAGNTNNNMNRPAEDLFNLGDNRAGADNMDLDLSLNEMVGAEDSVFDDIFFDNGDDGGIGGEEEMEHGDFDDAFFGLNN